MSASPAAASRGPSASPATEASWLTRRMCTFSCGAARATDEARAGHREEDVHLRSVVAADSTQAARR